MADGLICRHCGWQETNHLHGTLGEDDDHLTPMPGFKKSLYVCTGFDPKDKKEAKRIQRIRQDEEDWAGQCAVNRARNWFPAFMSLIGRKI